MSFHLVHDEGDEPSEWQIARLLHDEADPARPWVAWLTDYPDEGILDTFASHAEAVAALEEMGRVEHVPPVPPPIEFERDGPNPIVLIPIACLVALFASFAYIVVTWIVG